MIKRILLFTIGMAILPAIATAILFIITSMNLSGFCGLFYLFCYLYLTNILFIKLIELHLCGAFFERKRNGKHTKFINNCRKKRAQAFVKKKAEDMSDNLEEINTSISLNPLKAKSLNVGEDERMRKINEKWEKQKRRNLKEISQKLLTENMGKCL